MDRRMRRSNLIDKAMLQFTICVTILMLLATPLFYWLTKHYYAEDLILVIDTIKHGKDIPPLDVERDIMHGIMIQFGLIICIIGISVILIRHYKIFCVNVKYRIQNRVLYFLFYIFTPKE